MSELQQQQQQITSISPSPFTSIPLLNLIIDFYCHDIKHTTKVSQIDSHFRRAIQKYCDSTWRRLTMSSLLTNKREQNIATSSINGIEREAELLSAAKDACTFTKEQNKTQLLFIECCRRGFDWIVKGLLRGGGDLIDINLGVELFAVNYGDNVTPLVAACAAAKVDVVKVLLSYPDFLVKDHEDGHHHKEFTSEMMMLQKSSSIQSGMFLAESSEVFLSGGNDQHQHHERDDCDSVDKQQRENSPRSPTSPRPLSTLMNRCDVNKTTAQSKSPLLSVCSNNINTPDGGEIVRLLLESGAKFFLDGEDEEKENADEQPTSNTTTASAVSSPLVLACLLGKESIVRAISDVYFSSTKHKRNIRKALTRDDPVMRMSPMAAAGSKTAIVELLKGMMENDC